MDLLCLHPMMKQAKFSTIPFHPAKAPFFYGWWIVVVGTVGVLMSAPGQTIGISTFTDSLIEALHISRDQLSWAYMIGTILSATLLTRAGQLYDRFGARPIAMIAAICLASGLLYLSQIDRVALFVTQSTNIAIQWTSFVCVLLGFLAIRFFGQGVLTLVSRGMMMKWFDRKRGFALGFSNFFMAIGFSFAPLTFEWLIQSYGWRGAWQFLAMILAFSCPIFIFLFFRNDPADSDLLPDGKMSKKRQNRPQRFVTSKDFTLNEARSEFSFWVIAALLSMNGLYQTGFAFNIVSIFEQIGSSRAEAVQIFPWIAGVAGLSTLIFSIMSDYVKIKYLLFAKAIAAFAALLGFIYLETGKPAYYALIVGNGIMTSLYGVIGAVVWIRFYGKFHLGAILGQVMMLSVFSSALGPILFSKSFTVFNTYDGAAWLCLAIFFILFVGTFFVRNPQPTQMSN